MTVQELVDQLLSFGEPEIEVAICDSTDSDRMLDRVWLIDNKSNIRYVLLDSVMNRKTSHDIKRD